MYRSRVMLLGFIFVLLVGLGLPIHVEARATGNAAILQEVNGEVTFVKGGGKRSFTAYNGAALQQGDSVRTGEDSSVHIVLENEDEIVLGADSHIVISELVDNNTSIKLSSGGLWNKIKSFFGANDTYEIETPTAIMGVRGTLFHVDVGVDDAMLRVFDGLVGVNEPREERDDDDREVGVFEQHSASVTDGSSLSEQLDIRSYLEVADRTIIVQTLQDIIEAAELRGERAQEHEREYQQTRAEETIIDALRDANNAVLLAELARAITDEVEHSPRFEEIQRTLLERDLSWEQFRQQVQTGVSDSNDTAREIEALAAEANVDAADHIKPISDKIEQLKDSHPPSSGGSTDGDTAPTPSPGPSPGPSPDPDPGPGEGEGEEPQPEPDPGEGEEPQPDPEPSTAIEVTATFEDSFAEAFGTFEGIDYGLLIPQLSGDGDSITFTIDKPSPDLIAAGAGPVHALSITGLEGREGYVAMGVPDGADGNLIGYHYKGNGRWEPRSLLEVDLEEVPMIGFESEFGIVAVAEEVYPPHLFIIAQSEEGVTLGWEGAEGIQYELLKDDVIIPIDDPEVFTYEDTDLDEVQHYTMRAVRAGFESPLSNTVSVIDKANILLEASYDGKGLQLIVNMFPHDRPIVATQIHIGIEGDVYRNHDKCTTMGEMECLLDESHVTSVILGDANSEEHALMFKWVYAENMVELIVSELLYGSALETGHVVEDYEMIEIDLKNLMFIESGTAEFKILDAMFIDVDGNPIELYVDDNVVYIDSLIID